MGNLYLIVVTIDNIINIWNIRTCEKLLTITDHENEILQITLAGQENRYLAICYGCKNISSWDLVDFKKQKSIDLQAIEVSNNKNDEIESNNILESTTRLGSKIVLSNSCHEDKIGYAFRGTSNAYMFDTKSGVVSNKYTTKFESGFINSLELTGDYFIILCKLTRSKGSDLYKIELHEIKRGQLSRIVEGCFDDNLIDVSLSITGSHLVGICYSEITQTSELTFWNIESEEHRHLCISGTSVSPNRIIATDLRYVLTTSVGNFNTKSDDIESKQVKIWNLASRFGKPGGKYQVYDDDGIESISMLAGLQPRYALTRHFQNKRVSIWDLDAIGNKHQEPKTPTLVYSEGGNVTDKKIVFKASDIILTYNDINILYILTDKGTSQSEGGESWPIFESVHVYNLKEERYEYKVQKSFICAYDTNEYLIVGNKLSTVSEHDIVLVGLSENRNHFIINSIKTGHILKRMRTNFKEEKRKRNNDKLVKDPSSKSRRSLAFNSSDFGALSSNDLNDELNHEKETKNIEQFIISADNSTIVASYHARHLCVFDLSTFNHVQTLEDSNCMLFLYVSNLTNDGKYLVHHTYDTMSKFSYITIWNCKSGKIRRRLKNETNVISISISDDANHVLFCKQNGHVKYWNPFEHGSLRTLKYDGKFCFEIDTKIQFIKENTQAVVISGKTYSLWDIQNGCLINMFTNDFKFTSFSIVLKETMLLFGHKTSNAPICVRLPK
jgi:hypothetical protein